MSSCLVRGLSCLILSIAATGLLAQQPSITISPPSSADPSNHVSGLVTVNGVRVPYLDWGGSGVALVFIPGMGNSAHVFDDFAPRFTDKFRVLGVTRVGFGESDQPESEGYDLASRVEHIWATLDRLRLEKAVLVGHSLGGDEITAFAGAHPERTAGLIYLDAGIDHTVAMQMERMLMEFFSEAPQASAGDLASPQAYQRFLSRIRGVEFPIGEVLATTLFDATGVVQGPRAAPRVFSEIVAGIAPPEFTQVRAPTLSLYSDSTVAEYFPWLPSDSVEYARATEVVDEQLRPSMEEEREKFAQEVRSAQIFTYRAHHYQFLSDPEDTERRMRTFLSSLVSL